MSTRLRDVIAALCPAVALLASIDPACAQNISCTSSMSNLSFGTVNPLASLTTIGATLTWSCTNASTSSTRSATVCFSIGEPGGRQTNPRQMLNGTNTLNFQMYQDPALSTVWGSSFFGTYRTPLIVNITLAARGTTGTRTNPLYGQVPNGQITAIPGAYSDVYASGDTAITINEVAGSTPSGVCATASIAANFPFTVSATVAKQCTVTANSNLNLGSVPPTSTNVTGSNSLAVTCSNATPYYIGLAPSNGNANGAGTMKGAPGNTDVVPYQLRSTPGWGGTVWGNTATTTAVGNGVAGTGNGSAQALTVYATAPSADFAPDTYSDTVTVNVNY